MAPDQLSISLASRAAPGGHLEQRAGELVADLKAAFPTSIVVPLVPAGLAGDRPSADATGSRGSTVYAQGGTEVLRQGVSYVHSGALWIGGPDLLRAFHAERGTPELEAGKVVAVGPDSTDHGVVHLVVEGESGERPLMDLPAVEAGETRYASLSNSGEFNYVISPESASRAGLAPALPPDQNAQFIFRGTGPLSQRDISRAKAITARHPGAFVVSLGDLGSHGGPVRTILTLSGAVVALAILEVVLALVGAEARRDRAILVAVGADPRIRRRLSGANGFLIAALAGALAIPAGFTPVAIYEIGAAGGQSGGGPVGHDRPHPLRRPAVGGGPGRTHVAPAGRRSPAPAPRLIGVGTSSRGSLADELESGELRVVPVSKVRDLIRETGRRVVAENREAIEILERHDRRQAPAASSSRRRRRAV